MAKRESAALVELENLGRASLVRRVFAETAGVIDDTVVVEDNLAQGVTASVNPIVGVNGVVSVRGTHLPVYHHLRG